MRPNMSKAIPYSTGKLGKKISFLVLIFKIPVLGPIGGVFLTVSENYLIFQTSFRRSRPGKLDPNFPWEKCPEN